MKCDVPKASLPLRTNQERRFGQLEERLPSIKTRVANIITSAGVGDMSCYQKRPALLNG